MCRLGEVYQCPVPSAEAMESGAELRPGAAGGPTEVSLWAARHLERPGPPGRGFASARRQGQSGCCVGTSEPPELLAPQELLVRP